MEHYVRQYFCFLILPTVAESSLRLVLLRPAVKKEIHAENFLCPEMFDDIHDSAKILASQLFLQVSQSQLCS